jgi:formamidopyrimidine-DNA glycosylase
MPELPEVESVRRLVERRLRGRRITRVATRPDPIVFDGAGPRRVAAALLGRRVLGAGRVGKHFWIELDRRPWPLFHLGMSGWVDAYREGAPRPRFWKLEVSTADGTRVAFTDPRRLGRIRLRADPRREPPVCELGFDPLEGLPPARDLWTLLARRAAPTKAVLLDQSLFAGVGNWIADEVLYQARLDPRRPASSLDLAEVARLRGRILAIVRRAVAVGADSERFPRTWLFHHRWGRRRDARTARGEEIVHLTVGGRTTAFVPSRLAPRRASG